MVNEIDKIRCDINQYFDENNCMPNSEHYELSEGGLYHYTSQRYRQTDTKRNWIVCKIEIWDVEKNIKIYEYITDADDNDYCACWFTKNNNDYLILPEAFQGYSVFDVQNRRLHSFYSSNDPFIWISVLPSPDGNKIAVDGCYWACPNELRIYDTTNLSQLPFALLYQQNNFTNQNECIIKHWQDNQTLAIFRNGAIEHVKV